MPVPAVSGIASAIAPVQGVAGTGYLSAATNETAATDGTGFATALAGAVDNVQQLQSTSNSCAPSSVSVPQVAANERA